MFCLRFDAVKHSKHPLDSFPLPLPLCLLLSVFLRRRWAHLTLEPDIGNRYWFRSPSLAVRHEEPELDGVVHAGGL